MSCCSRPKKYLGCSSKPRRDPTLLPPEPSPPRPLDGENVQVPTAYNPLDPELLEDSDACLNSLGRYNFPSSPKPPGLRTNLRNLLLDELPPKGENPLGAVLVLDDATLEYLEGVLKVNDLTKCGLPVVELIYKRRQPLPQLPVVYAIQPTLENAGLLRDEWLKGQPYKEIHIVCFGMTSPSFAQAISQCAPIQERLRAVKELRLQYHCASESLFILPAGLISVHANPVSALERFYGRKDTPNAKIRAAKRVAEGIVNVLATMGDRPHIRFQNGSHCCELVAKETARLLSEQSVGSAQSAGGTLLILDRTYDLATPLLHTFTYEAMLCDVRPGGKHKPIISTTLKNGVIKVERRGTDDSPVSVALDDDELLWKRFRYKHIESLSGTVSRELRTLLQSSKAVRVHPEVRRMSTQSTVSVSELGDAVREMPAFQKQVRSYNLHTELLLGLKETMQSGRLADFALMEQNLVTMEAPTGERGLLQKLKRAEGWKQLLALLSTRAPDGYNKIRLILIYVLTQGGVTAEEKTTLRELISKAYPSYPLVDEWIAALKILGAETEREAESTSWLDRRKEKPRPPVVPVIEGDEVVVLSRTRTKLLEVADGLLGRDPGQVVRREVFPYVNQFAHQQDLPPLPPPPVPHQGTPVVGGGLRPGKSHRRRPSWSTQLTASEAVPPTRARSNSEPVAGEPLPGQQAKGPRTYIFVLGGIAPSEVAEVGELAEELNREVILGATSLLTAEDFVSLLPKLIELPTPSYAQ